MLSSITERIWYLHTFYILECVAVCRTRLFENQVLPGELSVPRHFFQVSKAYLAPPAPMPPDSPDWVGCIIHTARCGFWDKPLVFRMHSPCFFHGESHHFFQAMCQLRYLSCWRNSWRCDVDVMEAWYGLDSGKHPLHGLISDLWIISVFSYCIYIYISYIYIHIVYSIYIVYIYICMYKYIVYIYIFIIVHGTCL